MIPQALHVKTYIFYMSFVLLKKCIYIEISQPLTILKSTSANHFVLKY